MGKSQEHKDTAQCPQCGAEVKISQWRKLANCPFCGSRLRQENSEPPKIWLLRPSLSRSECYRLMSAWLWENYLGTANGLDIDDNIWVKYVRIDGPNKNKGHDHNYQMAGGYPDRFSDIKLPPGEKTPFEPDSAYGFVLPADNQSDSLDNEIIFVPFYAASYSYAGNKEIVGIEAATGSIAGYKPDKRIKFWEKWAPLAFAGLIFIIEAWLIGPVIAKTIILGISFVAFDLLIGLLWGGWLWRR